MLVVHALLKQIAFLVTLVFLLVLDVLPNRRFIQPHRTNAISACPDDLTDRVPDLLTRQTSGHAEAQEEVPEARRGSGAKHRPFSNPCFLQLVRGSGLASPVVESAC